MKGCKPSKLLSSSLTLGLILGLSYSSVKAIVWGDARLLLLILLGAIAAFTLLKWRIAVIMLVIAICFEGVLFRAFYSSGLVVLFLKGFWALLIYLGILTEFKWKRKPVLFDQQILKPAIVFLVISFIHLFNPNTPNMMVGLVGFGLLWIFFPMYFVGYHTINSKNTLLKFFFILAIASLPVSIMGINQFFRGVGAPITPGFAYDNPASLARGVSGTLYFRPPSTFTFVTQLGSYLLFAIPMLIGLTCIRKAVPWKGIVVGAAVLAFTITVLSGSRAVWVWVIIEIGLIAILLKSVKQKFVSIAVLLLLIGMAYPIMGEVLKDRFPTVPADMESRLRHGLVMMPSIALGQTILGKGAGTATGAARYFSSDIFFPESYWVKIMYEYGIPGLIAFLFILTIIVRRGYVEFKSLKDKDLQWMGIALFVFVTVSAVDVLWYGFDQTPMNMYFWFFSGVLMKLSKLEKESILASHLHGSNRKV